ncbi:MAG: hypothetical protein ACK4YP_15865, partial [Myxococcota bacterium]
ETGADTDTGGATDLCAPRDASTTTVSETQVNTAYPVPAGGAIADGTYDLVRFEVYTPATADDHARARRMVFEGDTVVAINVDDGAPQPILGGTWSTGGTDLSFAITCPTTGTVTLPYTASGDELWLFDPEEPNVQVYTRQ